MSRYHNQNGVALVQILVLAAIFSVIGLSLITETKKQLKLAETYQSSVIALAELRSIQSQILFSELTMSENVPGIQTGFKNYFNKPFWIKNTKVSIQDQSGLIHAFFPNPEHFVNGLAKQGIASNSADAILNAINDWQDLDSDERNNGAEAYYYQSLGFTPRNGTVPSLAEFKKVKGVSPDTLKVFDKWMSIYRIGGFNPMSSPDSLLSSMLREGDIATVLDRRNAGILSKQEFSDISGFAEDMETNFNRSNVLQLSLQTTHENALVKRSVVVQLKPYSVNRESPVRILSQMYTVNN